MMIVPVSSRRGETVEDVIKKKKNKNKNKNVLDIVRGCALR